MTRLLPALHEGHAPIYLHHAFCEALEAYEDWAPDDSEPSVECDGRTVPISSVFGRMRRCTDLLPARIVDQVDAMLPDGWLLHVRGLPTYADAAHSMRALCIKRLRAAQ